MNKEELCEMENLVTKVQILLDCLLSSFENNARTRKMSCEEHVCYEIKEHLQKIYDSLMKD